MRTYIGHSFAMPLSASHSQRLLMPSNMSVSLSLHSQNPTRTAAALASDSLEPPASLVDVNQSSWSPLQPDDSATAAAHAFSWNDSEPLVFGARNGSAVNETSARVQFASSVSVVAKAAASALASCSKSSLFGGLEHAVYLYAVPLVCALGVALNVLSLVVLAGCACPVGACCCGASCSGLERRRRRRARLFRAPTYWLMRAIALADAISLALSAPIGYVRCASHWFTIRRGVYFRLTVCIQYCT